MSGNGNGDGEALAVAVSSTRQIAGRLDKGLQMW